MTDGNLTPIALDGMAAFAAGSHRVRLVRNHEDRNGPTHPLDAAHAYDPLGGSVTLEVGPDRTLLRDFVSLSGTIVNCAGGPRGGIVMCEDGDGVNYVRGLTSDGEPFDLAKNILNDFEWAGATFSPDGQTLFVNIQGPTSGQVADHAGERLTVAIWGPWERGAL